jgi:heat shock protein HslJ
MKSVLFRGCNRPLVAWFVALSVVWPMVTDGQLAVGQQSVPSIGAFTATQETSGAMTGRQELEKLKWLIGQWKTSGDAAIPAKASAQWAADGNFLVLDYEVSPPGFPVISASDRIAWDPSGKSFRSWTFRGDGGFGQANWVARETGWMIRYGGTHSDGRQLSSTLLLVQTSEGKLQLSAIERWVGDEQFPDLVLELEPEQAMAIPLVSIENKTWELTRLASGPSRSRNRPTLKLVNQELEAFGGINQVGGQYQRSGESLRFRNLVSTLMGGNERDSEFEQEFSAMLEKVTRFTLENNQLILWAEDKQVAWFDERKTAPASFDLVREITWELVELRGVAVPDDSRPTLRFGDGTVEGYGGVNQMGGTYNQTENALSFGPMRSTRRGGPQPALQLEAKFGQALATVDRFDITDDQLILSSGTEIVAKFRRQEK